MKNYKKYMMLELTSSYPSCPLEILLLNGLQIEEFSVQEESLNKISTELLKLQVQLYKLL